MQYAITLKYKFLLLLTITVSSSFVFGQSVSVSTELNETKDTILLSVFKQPGERAGTLLCIAQEKKSTVSDTFYFPIIDTFNYFNLAIPIAFSKGQIQLKAFYYPKVLEVNGTIKNNKKNQKILSFLITNNKKLFTKIISPNEFQQFNMPGLVFENKASLIFNYIGGTKKIRPNIEIIQTPTTKDFKDSVFYNELILTPIDTVKNIFQHTDSTIRTINNSFTNDKIKVLETVTLKAQKKSQAEKYNEQYTGGMFNSADEKLINCLDNTLIESYPDCLSFLRTQIPGLMITISKFGDNQVTWRGIETKLFFIDEIEVDIEQIAALNTNEIAIIKAFPPPYSGSGGAGNGGAIAVYTKRGEFRTEGSTDNRWIFSIKGYAPSTYELFQTK